MSEITRAYKREWLFDNGYMKVVDGTEYLSLKAMHLLTGVSPERWKDEMSKAIKNGMRFRKSMTQDVLRGAKEIQARLGTNDLVEILYAEATI